MYDIVHLTTVHSPNDNRISRKECPALQGAGFRVALVASERSEGTYARPEVPFYGIGTATNRVVRAPHGWILAWRALRTLRPRLLHVHDPELIPLAILWRRLRKGRAIFDAHEDLPSQVLQKTYLPPSIRGVVALLARQLLKLADRHLDAIIIAEPVLAKLFTNPRTTLVQNFPNLDPFAEIPPLAPKRPNLRPTIVYVGGLTRDRGIDVMLKARSLSKFDPHLILAGPADAYAMDVLSRARPEDVTYLGVRPPEDIPSVIAKGDIGLVVLAPRPNYRDAQPTKLFEYMAAARPFIASDFSTWKKLAAGCGVFVEPTCPDLLASAIDQLLSDRSTARAMGLRGREQVAQRFSFGPEADRLIGLSRTLLEDCRD